MVELEGFPDTSEGVLELLREALERFGADPLLLDTAEAKELGNVLLGGSVYCCTWTVPGLCGWSCFEDGDTNGDET